MMGKNNGGMTAPGACAALSRAGRSGRVEGRL